MKHGAEARFGYKPFSTHAFGKIYGLDGAEANANAASFTGKRIDEERWCTASLANGSNSAETAFIPANSAIDAIFLPDDGFSSTLECMALFNPGRQYQMKIRGIDITIHDYG
jgi:hypothetical protein